MVMEKIVRFVAGTVVLTSILLSHYVDERWLFLTGLVGINLILSAAFNWCPLEWVLKKCGMKSCCQTDK